MPQKRLAVSCLIFSMFALAESPTQIDAGKTTAGVFESTFFHFRYELPKGWFALDDKVRIADNEKRYEAAAQETLEKQGPSTPAHTTSTVVPYSLLLASRTAVTASDARPLPRIAIQADEQTVMMSAAGDPAKMILDVVKPKVLRGPEDVVIAGHKFVRADFQMKLGSFLSKFVTVNGDYLIEFDLRADNEKDLAELTKSMESLQFSDH
ncbi:MAG: hypothetical protein WAL58_12585 [Terriglobales bacterium]|jgi:hypothetical protein